jgi:HEAT repeat protein
LVSKLKDRDWFVRYKASVALGKMPSDLDFDAIENLTKTLLDENEYVSSTSEHILRKVIETMAKNDPLYEEITKNLKKKNPDEDKMRTISKKIFKEDPTALKKEDTSLKKLPLAKEIPLILKEETKKIPLDKETSKEEKKIFGEDTPGSESLD